MLEENDILTVVGNNLKAARMIKGYDQKQVSEDAKIDKDYYGKIERGEQNFTIKILIKLAKILDVTIEELFIQNGNLLSLRFVISEHNINTLKEVVQIVKNLIEKK